MAAAGGSKWGMLHGPRILLDTRTRHRRDRSTGEDGLRRILYILVKANGDEDLAVTAKEVKSSGGHYSYHAVRSSSPPGGSTCLRSCSSASTSWA